MNREEDRCSYKMHSLTQDRTGRQTALGYDALNEGPAGSGGGNCLVAEGRVTGQYVDKKSISANGNMQGYGIIIAQSQCKADLVAQPRGSPEKGMRAARWVERFWTQNQSGHPSCNPSKVLFTFSEMAAKLLW